MDCHRFRVIDVLIALLSAAYVNNIIINNFTILMNECVSE